MEDQELVQEEANEQTEPKVEKKKSSLKKMVIHLLIIVFIGLVTTLGFFYVYLPNITNHGETITVPDLIEVSMYDLEEVLLQRGLRFEVNDSVYSSKYPPLTIVQQYPEAGSKVKEGRKIFLSVNRNTVPTVSFPEDLFAGEKSLTHVKAVLNNLDVEIEKVLVRSGKFFNLVLEARYDEEPIQNGDRIPKGSSVVVVVSDGYGFRGYNLPNFFGMLFEDADVVVKGADLNLEPLNITPGVDTTDQEIIIIRQSPDPDTPVRIGENITFWVDIKIDSTYYHELFPDTTLQNTIIDPSVVLETDSTKIDSLNN